MSSAVEKCEEKLKIGKGLAWHITHNSHLKCVSQLNCEWAFDVKSVFKKHEAKGTIKGSHKRMQTATGTTLKRSSLLWIPMFSRVILRCVISLYD